MSEDVIRLWSAGLLSKWGFSDGDVLEDVLYDWWESAGLGVSWNDVDEHVVLRRLVRQHLLPALDQSVQVTNYETIHNPIRAYSIDGVGVPWDDITSSDHGDWHLTPEYVDVPVADVLRIAGEVHATPAPQ